MYNLYFVKISLILNNSKTSIYEKNISLFSDLIIDC